ncbi:MAG: hypothetical protein U0Y68_00525 [Blastocatellia bacterium]
MNNTQINATSSHKNQSTFSLRHLLATPLLLAALFAAPAAAQESKSARPEMTARFGLKADALKPQSTPETYQANPMSDARLATDSLLSRTATMQLNSTSGVSDMVGTTSVEDFQGMQAKLSNTHESADGFRNYFNTWYTPNFARRDSAVSVWLFHDFGSYNYDLWNSGGTDLDGRPTVSRGIRDTAGMSSANRFFAPMGANWANKWMECNVCRYGARRQLQQLRRRARCAICSGIPATA